MSELVKPSASVGILAVGSIPWQVATELSDLDLWVLLSDAGALKGRRPREIGGAAVKELPTDCADRLRFTVFLSGIEIDLLFLINPAVDRGAESGTKATALSNDPHGFETSTARLATGWTLHGEDIVARWQAHYGTGAFRLKWMAQEFTAAAKDLEDMEIGIGRAAGHVPAIGAFCASSLLRALMAYAGHYNSSIKSMLRIRRMIDEADPELRAALIEGRALAFPGLLQTPDDERAYFERIYAYCGTVKKLLSREEGMGDILDSVIHDLDIIL